MLKLFVFLLVLHMVGDFYLQNHTICDNKYKYGVRGIHLYLHLLIIFGVFSVSFFLLYLMETNSDAPLSRAFQGLLIGSEVGGLMILTHFLIDALKSKIERIELKGKKSGDTNKNIHGSRYELWTFLGDQFLHFIAIYWTAWVVFVYILTPIHWQKPLLIENLGIINLVFILMFVICGKPANVLTRRILIYRQIMKEDPGHSDDVNKEFDPQTGKFIGSIERRLILFFMFINAYAAIGFLITAKSILRFSRNEIGEVKGEIDAKIKYDNVEKDVIINGRIKSTDDSREQDGQVGENDNCVTDRSEYILVGTFVSVSIAIICGYLVMIVGKSRLLLDFSQWLLQASGIL